MNDTDREWSQHSLLAHVGTFFAKAPTSLAEALADLQTLTACAEGCLSEELLAVFGDYEKFTFDYYDMSFEVHGVTEGFVCTPEQQAHFWELGFYRFWTHERSERRRPGERYYCRPRPPSGGEESEE